MPSLRTAFLLSAVVLLSACGFHLKGTQGALSYTPDTLYLVTPDNRGDLALVLRDYIDAQKITLLKQGNDALTVVISDIDNRRIEKAMGNNTDRTREIELNDGFVATISRDGVVLGTRRISSQTSIEYASNTYLGNSEEEREAHIRLMRENADKLLRFISAVGKP
ncbi:hypothetical protein L0B52_04450 [Suttonella sp. R2A3]|uniref:LPS-assembly lipoprotein LptE n=1 Tax=Suttonella sp. R2A3 TaxID=2908648 RepID=UPI001F2D9BDF|nr:LPS assembly lipoprotein LptE [Suttonella sp. R2A3]UJF25403.1 hypothetical protein L0B52_04450 [Suttonella sp. R2A3]